MTHTPDPQLFERPISILVVGCRENGSAIAACKPHRDNELYVASWNATPCHLDFS